MSRMVSFLILVGIILLVGTLFFRVMAMFFIPLFFAALLVVMFRPLHAWLLRKCRGREWTAAGLTTAAIVLMVLVPIVGITALAAVEGSRLLTRLDVRTVQQKLQRLRDKLGLAVPGGGDLRSIEGTLGRLYPQAEGEGAAPRSPDGVELERLQQRIRNLQSRLREDHPQVDLEPLLTAVGQLRDLTPGTLDHDAAAQQALRDFREFKLALLGGPFRAWLVDLANPSDEQIRQWTQQVFAAGRDWLLSIGGKTLGLAGKLLVGTLIMIVSLFFFFLDGSRLTAAFMQLSPLDDQYERELIHEFDQISRAVVVAVLLSAAVQGLLAGIGYWLAGVDSVFLLTALTAAMALVPFVGTSVIWVPVCLWLYFSEERPMAAILLGVYGACVVSTADNFIKPWVLQGQAKLHPLLALLSVLGGVQALGPIGVLVGPMVVVFLQTLLNILHREMSRIDRETGTPAVEHATSPPGTKRKRGKA